MKPGMGRPGRGWGRHCVAAILLCAARAAATACASWASVDWATWPMTSPVAGLYESNHSTPATWRPSMVFRNLGTMMISYE